MVESKAILVRKRALSPGNSLSGPVFEMTMETGTFERPAPGRFLNVSVPGFPLKRPFGIADFDETRRRLTFAFRVAGRGTSAMAAWPEGFETRITFPLGHGFDIDPSVKRLALVGGGVGVFPLLSVLRERPLAEVRAFLGYASRSEAYYLEEFSKSAAVRAATDDGSLGRRGFVTELLAEELESWRPDLVLACGPRGMFLSLKKLLAGKIPCQASAEERMGCGVGACLVCACDLREEGEIRRRRVCRDGPVFDLEKMEF